MFEPKFVSDDLEVMLSLFMLKVTRSYFKSFVIYIYILEILSKLDLDFWAILKRQNILILMYDFSPHSLSHPSYHLKKRK